MFKLINKYFSNPKNSNDEPQKHDIKIATCVILVEMANIDGEFSNDEYKNIVSYLKNKFNLSDEVAKELIESSNIELNESNDLWQYTNLINQTYSYEEKIDIIKTVWDVVYSDGKLDKHEDYLVHKLANLLRLTHKDLIDNKIRGRKKLNNLTGC